MGVGGEPMCGQAASVIAHRVRKTDLTEKLMSVLGAWAQ